MYFLTTSGKLCHIIEDIRTGEAPDPCVSRASKIDILHYREGKPHRLMKEKPQNIPLCKHCEKAVAWMRNS
jgi:hypothetical protein